MCPTIIHRPITLRSGTSETPSHVPGLNRIGAMMDDVGKSSQPISTRALRGLGLGREASDHRHRRPWLKDDDYVQFICAHLPIEGKRTWPRTHLHMNSVCWDTPRKASRQWRFDHCGVRSASKTSPNNFEWPAGARDGRLRQAAQEAQQGDGMPAGNTEKDAEDTDADEPDAPIEDTRRPVDPVTQVDAENQTSAPNWMPHGRATSKNGWQEKRHKMRCTGCDRTS